MTSNIDIQNMWWSSYRVCQCHRSTHWQRSQRGKEKKKWTFWLPNSSYIKKLSPSQYRTSSHLWNDWPRTYNNLIGKLKRTENNFKKTTKNLRRKCPMHCQYRSVFLLLGSRCSAARERGYTPQRNLRLYMHDHREYKRKWEGKPTSALAAPLLRRRINTTLNSANKCSFSFPWARP